MKKNEKKVSMSKVIPWVIIGVLIFVGIFMYLDYQDTKINKMLDISDSIEFHSKYNLEEAQEWRQIENLRENDTTHKLIPLGICMSLILTSFALLLHGFNLVNINYNNEDKED